MKKLILICFAVAGLCSMTMMNVSESDLEFVRNAADAGMLEVKLGELAQKNGVSPEVKKLGAHMVTDHSKTNDELKALADKKNIILPPALSEKHQQKYNELAAKKGIEFDKAYTKCMVSDHKKVIKMFEKQSKKADDPELRTFAAKTQPVLEHHLHMSKETCKELKKN